MSDDQDKALRDMLAYGNGVMMDGKHVPLDQYLLDDQILLFGEGNLPPEKLAALERMEHAIRADERAKVIEECVKVLCELETWEVTEGGSMYPAQHPYGCANFVHKDESIDAIRSLGSKDNG